MNLYNSLKLIWKKLGINGQVKNFSSKELCALENDSGAPTAYRLPPGYKTPLNVDCDAFKRADNIPIEKHKNWWKFYDVSTVEIHDQGNSIKVSDITKTAVDEVHFGKITYKNEIWGTPIQLVTDVKRNKQKQITGYLVTRVGLISPDQALTMACHHEIDNARPVFPKGGIPYIRTRRDLELPNNISTKGLV